MLYLNCNNTYLLEIIISRIQFTIFKFNNIIFFNIMIINLIYKETM